MSDLKNCSIQCAPSPSGCLRCQSVPFDEITTDTSSILFASMDSDAQATLRKTISESDFEWTEYGSILVIRNVQDQLTKLAELLNQGLSNYTQSCIQASYAAGGLLNIEQTLAQIGNAKPLIRLIEHIEHEWVRSALNSNWLFSVFHPIIDSRTGEVFANEALLRAKNPMDGKVLGAGQIINACEKLNLTHQLDQRARQAAIRGAAQHVPIASKIFINFLPNTIYDPEICLRTTIEAANANNLSMDRLVFEVVETEKITDMAHLYKVLDYYRERGVGTAIDDMGAGYTSLEYITKLQPDFVKLDREFVMAAEQTAHGRESMDAVIASSHENGAKVIAEGIETVEQMSLCTQAGVDLLQGFLFAKPACPPQTVTFPQMIRKAA